MRQFSLTPIDRRFADFILRESSCNSPLCWTMAALTSAAVTGDASACLDLAAVCGQRIAIDGLEQAIPLLDESRAELERLPVVGAPGDFRPLILDSRNRLYLYRYWRYEQELARNLARRIGAVEQDPDRAALADGLCRLFPGSGDGVVDWQQVAALAALNNRFCVITGGPGTGKTSTVVKILALIAECAGEQPPRIALAAPTGKAAARLMESIQRLKSGLACDKRIKELIPDRVSTIHRLLGFRAGSTLFRYSGNNRLPHELVVVDEASMVALPLMTRLVAALKPDCRLILLGDRDQLASVEAGSVLGDLCGFDRRESFTSGFRRSYAALAGVTLPDDDGDNGRATLADAVVTLKKNYRFGEQNGIGALAALINAGRGEDAMELLRVGGGGVMWRDVLTSDDFRRSLPERVVSGYGPYLGAASPEEAVQRFEGFRILCPMRQGPQGVEGMTALVEQALAERGLIDRRLPWYRGRPVMITANDYGLNLFNGDVGVTFPDPRSGTLQVFFPTADGGLRPVAPQRLPSHETAYAITVHKSQGSEFTRILLALPGQDNELLTRELLYTAITRARQGVEIWGRRELFREAIARTIMRASGLGEALRREVLGIRESGLL